ncbi:MAG: hypothetical protein GC166_04645 [Alphaproteobacteria bacterium]|nr:hypothetical protein [Alphaproteobacteria bacterium]
MRKISITAVGAALLLFSVQSLSAEETSSSTVSADLDKIVCKTMAPPTGTRLGGRRLCQTQREWDAMHENTKQDLMKNQMQGIQQSPPGG